MTQSTTAPPPVPERSAVPPHLLAVAGPGDREVLAAVGAASRILVRSQPAIVVDPDGVGWKDDGTAVTSADRASEAVIVEAIGRGEDGDYRLVNEEQTSVREGDAATTWFIDPLDGTNAYRHGGSDYAILVSRWRDGAPRFSVVHYPALGTWLVTTEMGLHAEGLDRSGSAHAGALCLCYAEPAAKAGLSAAARSGVVTDQLESTEALMLLSLGRVDAVAVQIWRLRSWDIAPLVHAVEASGGRVSDERGERFALSGRSLSARFVLAARDEEQLQLLVRIARAHDQ